jgi:hypothetical protein
MLLMKETLCSTACIFIRSFKHDHVGSAKVNRREPKTGLGWVFNFKLGCFDDVRVLIYADARPHLQLKTRARFSPVSLSLSMDHG